MTQADRRIAALATGQLGAFTRAQANDIGLSDRQLRSRVTSGILIQTGPNAFRAAGAPTSHESELVDLVLDIGAPAWACGPSAAALHGFDGFVLRRPYHIAVPRERAVRRWNAVVHRLERIEPIDQETHGCISVTSPVRTLVDLARYASTAELARAVDSAIRDCKVVERTLHERIVALRSQGRFGLPLLAEVLAGNEVTRGGHSWLEREYLRLLDRAGLPKPEMQQVLARAGDRLVRVDCVFPGSNVVVELLGYRFHRSKREMERDAQRANALLGQGLRPYQFTYGQVVSDPDYVVTTSAGALSRAERRRAT
jgi:hypothetical protein